MNIAVLIPTVIIFLIDMYMKQCLYFHEVGARTLYACAGKNKIRKKIGQFSGYKSHNGCVQSTTSGTIDDLPMVTLIANGTIGNQ